MRFEIRKHIIRRDQQCVEVFDEKDRLVAVVYPAADGVKVVSKYMVSAAQIATGVLGEAHVKLDMPK